MAMTKVGISEASQLYPKPVILENIVKKKPDLSFFGNLQTPKIILERINNRQNFSFVSGKHTELRKYDVIEIEESFEDQSLIKHIPRLPSNAGQEKINHADYTVSVTVDTRNNETEEAKMSKPIFTVHDENVSLKEVILESKSSPDTAPGSLGAITSPQSGLCMKVKEIGGDNDVSHFSPLTNDTFFSLGKEEVTVENKSPTEGEHRVNDSPSASDTVESSRKRGLRRLEKQSYRNQYACEECVMKFRFLKDLQKHLREHSNSFNAVGQSSPFQPECTYKKKKLPSLDHSQLCQYSKDSQEHQLSFSSLQTLKKECVDLSRNVKINLNIKAYCCIECPLKFNIVEDLYRHSKQHTHNFNSGLEEPEMKNFPEETRFKMNPENKFYHCSDCPLKFRYLKCFHKHLERHKASATESSSLSSESKQLILLKEVRVNLGRRVEIKKSDSLEDPVTITESKLEPTLNGEQGSACLTQDENRHCCPDCSLKFRTFQDLHCHSLVHKKMNGLSQETDAIVDCKGEESNSERSCSPKKLLLTCPYCPKQSECKKVIEEHLLLHNKNEAIDYQRHAPGHIEEKLFSCVLCPSKMKCERSLKDHLQMHSHDEPEEKPLEVQNVLNDTSFTPSDRVRLLTAPCQNQSQSPEEQHSSSTPRDPVRLLTAPYQNQCQGLEESPFTCHLCVSRFTQNADLLSHLRSVHSEPKSFSCELCPRIFFQDSTLKLHLQTHHTEEDRFVCMVCLANFNEKKRLKKHLQSHFSGDRFTCAKCSKKFKEKGILQAHIESNSCKQKSIRLIDNNKKRFECPICPSKFTFKNSVNRHLKDCHSQNKYICNICSAQFQMKKLFKEHLRLRECVKTAVNPESSAETETLSKACQDTISTSEWIPDFIRVAGEPKFMLINSKVPEIDNDFVDEGGQRSSRKYSMSIPTGSELQFSSSCTNFEEKSILKERELSNTESTFEAKCAEWIILKYANEDIMMDVEN